MSIEQAEQLKKDFTDKWVVVDKNVPELRRFAEMTGKVKTVNMNCQALVEFDGTEDIGWYDIGVSYLTVVDGPVKKEKPKAAAKAAPKAAATGGKSPLDMVRQQGSAKAGGAKKPAGGPSPLDMIRKQGAGGPAKSEDKPTDEEKPAEPAAEAPAEEKKAAPSGGEKLSPLDLIRKQGAAKSKD